MFLLKSQIFSRGISIAERARLSSIMGFTIEDAKANYLGLPLKISAVKSKAFGSAEQNFETNYKGESTNDYSRLLKPC